MELCVKYKCIHNYIAATHMCVFFVNSDDMRKCIKKRKTEIGDLLAKEKAVGVTRDELRKERRDIQSMLNSPVSSSLQIIY